MTESFSAEDWRVLPLRGFDELRVGEVFKSASRTMTEANFAAFQTVSLDNHPIHYDDEYCKRLGHPGPLAHGLQVLSFTAAGAGLFPHVIGEKLIGFIEVNAKFLKAVFPGDTLELEYGREPSGVLQFAVRTPRDELAITHGVAEVDP